MSTISTSSGTNIYLDNSLNQLKPEEEKGKYILRLKKEGDGYKLVAEEKGILTWLKSHTFWRNEYNSQKITQFFLANNFSKLEQRPSELLTDSLKHLQSRLYKKTDNNIKNMETVQSINRAIQSLNEATIRPSPIQTRTTADRIRDAQNR